MAATLQSVPPLSVSALVVDPGTAVLVNQPMVISVAPLEPRGVVVLEVSARLGRVPVAAALAALARIGMTSLFVEGGSEVMGSFVRAGLFSKVQAERM